jgi:hypothetical protein
MARMGKITISLNPVFRFKTVSGAKKKIQGFRKLKRGLFGKTRHQSLEFLDQRIRKDMKQGHRMIGSSPFSNLKKARVN